MGIQQIISGFGKAADPQKILSPGRKSSADEEAKGVEEGSSKDKIDLSEDAVLYDQMVRELERTKSGIKDDPQNAIKAQANISGFSALEVLDDSFDSVFTQLNSVKDQLSENSKAALDTQGNFGKKSVVNTISD